MYTRDTQEKFIELRAEGWTLNHIATELHTSKRTLVDWNKEFAAQIQDLRSFGMGYSEEKMPGAREDDLSRLLRLQKDMEDELANRTLRAVPTEKLFRLTAELREEIREARRQRQEEEQSATAETNGHARGGLAATNGDYRH